MRRRPLLIIASVFLALIVVGVGGMFFAINAINRAIESRNGPVHRFQIAATQAFLTDEEAA
jgi:hypothetical protein